MDKMPHKLSFRRVGVEEGLLERGDFTWAKTSSVQVPHSESLGNSGPKAGWDRGRLRVRLRNLNCVRRQCRASDGGYNQRKGFQKIGQAEIWRWMNFWKTRGRET